MTLEDLIRAAWDDGKNKASNSKMPNQSYQEKIEFLKIYSEEIKALSNDWISVEDKLPEKDVTVISTDGEDQYFDSWCNYHECPVSFSSQTIITGEGWESEKEITHWMLLPKPPKE